MRRLLVIGMLVLSMVLIWGFSWQEESWRGNTMGTTYSIHVFKPGFILNKHDIPDQQVLQNKVEEALLKVNQSMSTYIPDSEISLLNRQPASEACYSLSQDFENVLEVAQLINKNTDGYFDATIGPLVDLWGFGGKSKLKINWQPPAQEQIAQVLQKVGFKFIEMHTEQSCMIKKSNVELDLSAVAKGYGVDVVAKVLESAGIDNYLVEIGGEVKVKGVKQPLRPWMDEQPWRILIEKPSRDSEEKVEMSAALKSFINKPLEIKDIAVATSGNYRNFYELNGQYFSHIINPHTGYPLEHQPDKSILTSVSVVDPSTSLADGYATGLYVLGLEKAKEVAATQNLEVVLVYEDKDTKQFDIWISPEFKINRL